MSFQSIEKHLGADYPYKVICGIDEAGRGPWAGPLVACALTMPLTTRVVGLDDSKKLTAAERDKLFPILEKKAQYGVGIVDSLYIDQYGLSKAVNQTFKLALQDLQIKHPELTPDFLLIDGRDKLALPFPYKTIIDGDQKIKLIAAASIIAKVTRDRMMQEESKKYPEYGFHEHMGYGTKRHQEALSKYGISPIHRKSYAPVFALFQSELFPED